MLGHRSARLAAALLLALLFGWWVRSWRQPSTPRAPLPAATQPPSSFSEPAAKSSFPDE